MNILEVIWTLSFFPCARISEVPITEILDCTLYVMYRWGHIKCFRFDNGRPFGDPKRETFSPLALHLVARGCEVLFNPPRTPTKNAKVERCQGTTGKWADATNSQDLEAFRENLEYAVVAQREKYKTRVCQGKTRMGFYPQLNSNVRRFNRKDFDVHRALKFLEQGKWYRKVSSVGQISLFSRKYQVGFQYRDQDISIKLSLQQGKAFWNCYDNKQNLIQQLYADNLNDGSYFDV